MAEGEKVNLLKAARSVTTPVFWVKAIMYGMAVGFLLFIGAAVKKAYFTKPAPSQPISVGEGGKVEIHNEAARKNFYIFTEPYVSVDAKQKGSLGIRAGVRWEF